MASTTGATATQAVGTNVPNVAPQRHPDEPESDSWDAADADTVTSMHDELPVTPRNVPSVKGAPAVASGGERAPAAAAPGTVRGPYQTSPGIGGLPSATSAARGAAAATTAAAAAAPLPSAMREEVWAIVRAAVEEAMGPVVARQKELEARAERAERIAGEAAKTAAARPAPPPPLVMTNNPASAAAKLSAIGAHPSIPVAMASLAPELISLAPDAMEAPDARARSAALEARPLPKISLPPQGTYGVTVMPSTRPKLDLENVGAVDISGFDGSRRKKNLGVAVAVIMVLIVLAVVTATLLSHS
ncbi:MAG: Translation initiation factor 2 [Labilithrix sp.]|nr:Translation initiation factor 2 [Labilithrix sp.]